MNRKGKIPYNQLAQIEGWPTDLSSYVPIKDAESFYFFSRGYLSKLCRLKRIPSIKVGGRWYVRLSEHHRRW